MLFEPISQLGKHHSDIRPKASTACLLFSAWRRLTNKPLIATYNWTDLRNNKIFVRNRLPCPRLHAAKVHYATFLRDERALILVLGANSVSCCRKLKCKYLAQIVKYWSANLRLIAFKYRHFQQKLLLRLFLMNKWCTISANKNYLLVDVSVIAWMLCHDWRTRTLMFDFFFCVFNYDKVDKEQQVRSLAAYGSPFCASPPLFGLQPMIYVWRQRKQSYLWPSLSFFTLHDVFNA